MSYFLRWITSYLVYFTLSEAPFQVKFWDLNSVILARQDLKTWYDVWLTLAHSHENRVGRSAKCKSCQVFGNAKSICDTNLWESIHHVRAQLLHTASPLIQHVGPGRQNFEVEQRVFLWRRWANPWLQPNTGDLAQTEKMQKMLKSEKSNPPAPTSFHPGHLQLLHQGMAGCRLTYQCQESHLVPEVHTDPPCTNGW